MSTLIPLPPPPTFEQAVRKYWHIRQLDRDGMMDKRAMVTSLATLAVDHPRLAPLCCRTLLDHDPALTTTLTTALAEETRP